MPIYSLHLISKAGFFCKRVTILSLGLDNSGKNTLSHIVKNNQNEFIARTHCPAINELCIGNVVLTTLDLGCHMQARRLWKHYFAEVSGIVFMVNASAPDRFLEAKAELDGLLSIEYMKNIPFLILGNELDGQGAMSEQEIRQGLGLEDITGDGKGSVPKRPVKLIMCSASMPKNYANGLLWLSQLV
ncbi:ADP-ribosylation factor family protein [Mucor mucedo]|uniref:ADP-ribosylation factor family protein n=1 Tax=Mucor mucedo TaxID=29922 RepID=UPI00221E9A9D|nr:ADP-ribosylation factor family protein [Mucor mucedo]KAI7887618.1 ADP-ribosylation factor family protein [Mucor mucedo]